MILIARTIINWKLFLETATKLGFNPTHELDKQNIKPETDLHYLTCLQNLDNTYRKMNINEYPSFLLHHIYLTFFYVYFHDIELKIMERSKLSVYGISNDIYGRSVSIISGTLYQFKQMIVEANDYREDVDYLVYINKLILALETIGYGKLFEAYKRVEISQGTFILVP